MKPSLAKNILLSIAVALLSLELFIRLGLAFLPRLLPRLYLGGAHPRNLVIADKELGYLLRPRFLCQETNDYKEYKITVNINSLGLRDYEHNLAENRFRILAIGDSYTFGEGVELENSYLSILENKLKDAFPFKDIEIIKAGIPGYGTKQEVAFLKRYIGAFSPRIVLMGFLPKETFRSESPFTYCNGYIVDSRKTDNLYLVSGRLYHSHAKNPVLGKLDAFLKHYYATPQFFQSRFKSVRKKLKAKKQKDQKEEPYSSQQLQSKFGITFSLFKEFKQICLEHKAKPLIVIIEGAPLEDNFVTQFADSAGIYTLSLYPFFKELSGKNIAYHFPHDLHWNTTGHKTAADAIFNFLQTHPELLQ